MNYYNILVRDRYIKSLKYRGVFIIKKIEKVFEFLFLFIFCNNVNNGIYNLQNNMNLDFECIICEIFIIICIDNIIYFIVR